MLDYRELAPPAELRPYVRCYWALEGRGDAAMEERILPDGAFELAFHAGDPFVRDGEEQPCALLIGEIRRPTVVTPSPRVRVFGVRFHPGAFAAFGNAPASELRDSITDARVVFGRSAFAQVEDAETIELRAAAFSRMLLQRRREPRHHALATAATGALACCAGRMRAPELAATLGVSERTLERAFDDCVGVGPKAFARLMRFRAHLAAPGEDVGYFDQAHVIRDFHEFAGVTPGVLLAERNAINDAFVGNFQDEAAGDR